MFKAADKLRGNMEPSELLPGWMKHDYRFWWENVSDKSLPPAERQQAYLRVKEMVAQWSDVRAIIRAIQDELMQMYKLVDVTQLS